ncbi:hypothetical protein Acy02nite_80360 [Actinoplanes cyaneus]|uniref:Uncharacterized protein n=1 Tax=Actinoplanes cyaneus TaxID=52696 RepID=A0A919IQ48_9ACTN|nr:hypothetical protein [Actinoplanes cyaneus]MCW2140809.1 hypothetical protein [Actinoplanes cyaneus]GID70155.1 hypothetical protein Acy02nite_80360 [Actinoplanes cyaneus]
MTFALEKSEADREISQKNLERGREEGREEGLVRSMELVLQTRFGDFSGLEDSARKLVADDHEANVARIVDGATLRELQQS